MAKLKPVNVSNKDASLTGSNVAAGAARIMGSGSKGSVLPVKGSRKAAKSGSTINQYHASRGKMGKSGNC